MSCACARAAVVSVADTPANGWPECWMRKLSMVWTKALLSVSRLPLASHVETPPGPIGGGGGGGGGGPRVLGRLPERGVRAPPLSGGGRRGGDAPPPRAGTRVGSGP